MTMATSSGIVRWSFKLLSAARQQPGMRFSLALVVTGLDNDVVVTVADLTDAERSVWAAFPAGAWVDLQTGDPQQDDLDSADRWSQDRTIRAEVVTALLLGASEPDPGHFPAVRLRGVRVTGRLDVLGATVTCALVCEQCYFDTAPRFVEAITRTVRLVDCRLAGFNGAGIRVEGILDLCRARIDFFFKHTPAT